MGTYFLFARPNFISGMARVLDLGATLDEYNSAISPDEADYYAIKSDWLGVGNDIARAVESYDKKEKTE